MINEKCLYNVIIKNGLLGTKKEALDLSKPEELGNYKRLLTSGWTDLGQYKAATKSDAIFKQENDDTLDKELSAMFKQENSDTLDKELSESDKALLHEAKIIQNIIKKKQADENAGIPDIMTSTTSTLPPTMEVIDYEGVITTSIVSSTNYFGDLIAAVSGGHSNIYMNKLNLIKKNTINALKMEANSLGCNAIIGLSINTEEISGGATFMLMVTVTGTAVRTITRVDTISDL